MFAGIRRRPRPLPQMSPALIYRAHPTGSARHSEPGCETGPVSFVARPLSMRRGGGPSPRAGDRAPEGKSLELRPARDLAPSTELGAVRRNVDRIEGRRSANEQAVELGAAESHVRDHFGNEDFADQRAVEVIAMDSLCCTRPNAAIPIDAKTVEQARCGLREDLATRQLGPARVDRETTNVARTVLFVRHAVSAT